MPKMGLNNKNIIKVVTNYPLYKDDTNIKKKKYVYKQERMTKRDLKNDKKV
jgi:hypothetical protein